MKTEKAKVMRSLRAERCYYATILINVNMYTRGLSIINNRVELHDINISAQKCVFKIKLYFLPHQIINCIDKKR
jgi:hypothetical protein